MLYTKKVAIICCFSKICYGISKKEIIYPKSKVVVVLRKHVLTNTKQYYKTTALHLQLTCQVEQETPAKIPRLTTTHNVNSNKEIKQQKFK